MIFTSKVVVVIVNPIISQWAIFAKPARATFATFICYYVETLIFLKVLWQNSDRHQNLEWFKDWFEPLLLNHWLC